VCCVVVDSAIDKAEEVAAAAKKARIAARAKGDQTATNGNNTTQHSATTSYTCIKNKQHTMCIDMSHVAYLVIQWDAMRTTLCYMLYMVHVCACM
jgi:hypothetical protein